MELRDPSQYDEAATGAAPVGWEAQTWTSSYSAHPIDEIEPMPLHSTEPYSQAFGRILGWLAEAGTCVTQSALRTRVLLMLLWQTRGGGHETNESIAKDFGITRAAVNKMAMNFRRSFVLADPRNTASHTNTTVRKCKTAQEVIVALGRRSNFNSRAQRLREIIQKKKGKK
jgi:hypothetical protein